MSACLLVIAYDATAAMHNVRGLLSLHVSNLGGAKSLLAQLSSLLKLLECCMRQMREEKRWHTVTVCSSVGRCIRLAQRLWRRTALQ